MPRRWLHLPLVALALMMPLTGGIPIGGSVHGAGTVSTYYIVTGGEYLGGGAFDANFACVGCYVRFTIDSGTVTVVQNGAAVTLSPGQYQIPGFAGFIGITTQGPNNFFFEIHGTGPIAPWAP